MRHLSKCLIVLALLAPVSHGATCPEPPTIPETDGTTSGYVWALRQRNANTFLALRDSVYGREDTAYSVTRVCDRELGRSTLYYAKDVQLLTDALFARTTKAESSFLYYESTEFLGHKEAGKAKLRGPELGFVPAKLLGEEHVELHFREPVELVPLSSGGHEPIPATVAVIATSHALSIAPLSAWGLDWTKNPLDRHIDLKWVWLKIDDKADVTKGAERSSLAELQELARNDSETVARLDRKPIFKNLAKFLKDYPVEDLDHLALLKDSWDVSSKGLDSLNEELARLPSGVVFDVLSTRTVTENVGYVKAFVADQGGRYFESHLPDRIDIKEQDIGGRILGKVRARVREEAVRRGYPFDAAPNRVEQLTVRADDPYFEIGNLVTAADLETLTYVFRLASCLAERSSVAGTELELLLARAGLPFRSDDQMRPLFRHWFRGFELPPASPIARDTPEEMIRRAAGGDAVRRYLDAVVVELEALLRSERSCATFVPSRIFLPPAAGGS